jgi:hypothetical protein
MNKTAWRGILFLILMTAILVTPAFAEEAAKAADGAAKEPTFWTQTIKYALEHAFTITIALVFVGAIVSSYLSRRLSDRCMKHLEGFPVTIEFKDGQRERGTLDAENNGLQLEYTEPMPSDEGTPRESFLLYQNEYAKIQTIACYEDTLDQKHVTIRLRRIRKSLSPGIVRRICRKIRNFYAAIKDAFGEAFALLMGQMKKAGPQAAVMKSQDKYVSKMGKQMIGAATASNYDPLLEKLIGRRVAVELMRGDGTTMVQEGLLKEYTKDFIELHETKYADGWVETVKPEDVEREFLGVKVRREDNQVYLGNGATGPVEVAYELPSPDAPVEGEEPPAPVKHTLTIDVGSIDSVELPSADSAITLSITCRKKADMVIPRHSATVRGRLPGQSGLSTTQVPDIRKTS